MKLEALSPEEFPRTLMVIKGAVSDGTTPGLVAGLWRESDPDRVLAAADGVTRSGASSRPVTVNTVFDLASVSKVVATATLATLLVDRAWIDWNTPLKALFPEYLSGEIRLAHLLSHTAGLPAWEPLWQRMRTVYAPIPLERIEVEARQREMCRLVFEVQPECAPGVRALYSDISFLILGFALEKVLQLPLDEAVKRLVWEPLGLRNSYYHRIVSAPSEDVHPEVAATEECSWRGAVLQGQVHDDNCWAMGGFGGHAGAFAPVHDVLALAKGWFAGFISPASRVRAWTRVALPPGCSRTLGWDTPSGEESSASALFSPHSVGHLGFTGTSLWVDPEARLAVAVLTNRVHSGRENILIRSLRPRLHRAIREDLVALSR